MNCSECEAQISEFLAGELSEFSSLAVRKHLQSCADCQSLADEFLTLKVEIEQALERIPVPDDLEERILTSIRQEYKTARRQVWLTGLTLISLGIPLLTLFSPVFLSAVRLFAKTISVLLHTWLTLIPFVVSPLFGLGMTLTFVMLAALGVYSLRVLFKGFQGKEVLL